MADLSDLASLTSGALECEDTAPEPMAALAATLPTPSTASLARKCPLAHQPVPCGDQCGSCGVHDIEDDRSGNGETQRMAPQPAERLCHDCHCFESQDESAPLTPVRFISAIV